MLWIFITDLVGYLCNGDFIGLDEGYRMFHAHISNVFEYSGLKNSFKMMFQLRGICSIGWILQSQSAF